MNSSQSFSDVIIAGAGPAGCACALALRNSGLQITVLDKEFFPRDKVCGDAIGSRVKSVLNKIDSSITSRLNNFPEKNISSGWKLFSPSGKEVKVNFVNSGYISKRMEFDNFLFEEVKKLSNVEILQNVKIQSFKADSNHAEVSDTSGNIYYSKIIIGCDGAHSAILRSTKPFEINPSLYSGSVRGYFKNVSGREENILEIHLVKNFLPGYFWIFPLDENFSNVGFGMLTKDISRRKIDLNKALLEIINSGKLKDRFKHAELAGEIKGFGLPLGGIKRKLSGERYLLCGDAASLIDPLNGEGIGNAILSGYIAAEQIKKCFANQNFSEQFNSAYDLEIHRQLLPELKNKLLMQKIFNRPWLIETLVSLGASSRFVREMVGRKL